MSFEEWLLGVSREYIIAISDGVLGDLYRTELHNIIAHQLGICRDELDDILQNLDKHISLEVDKLVNVKNIEIYSKALYKLLIDCKVEII
jgi:hypothetical protein